MPNDRSHLVPKRIVNKSGVATTVYVNPARSQIVETKIRREGRPKPTLVGDSSRIIPSPAFRDRPSVNVQSNTGLTINIVSADKDNPKNLFAIAEVPQGAYDSPADCLIVYDDELEDLYSMNGDDANHALTTRQKTELRTITRKVHELQHHVEFGDIDENYRVEDYLTDAAEKIESLIDEENRPRSGDNYSNRLLSENDDYRLYLPQNNMDTNYRIVDQKTGETYLVDIDEVVGAHEPETVDEDDESFLNLEDLKKLEDMDTIMGHVWKVLPAVD